LGEGLCTGFIPFLIQVAHLYSSNLSVAKNSLSTTQK
jgi:hypothetical protein